jgi:alanine dehydrogenase
MVGKRHVKKMRTYLKGLNVVKGKVVYKAVADAFNIPYVDVSEV